MGYRSQVAIAVGINHVGLFKSMLQDDDLEGAEVTGNSDCMIYYWDSIKWYSSYEDVERIEDAIEYMQHHDLDFEFRRVGEESGDVIDICTGDHDRWTFISTTIGIY